MGRFLIDANLPVALARAIAAGGYQAAHVADIDVAGADDRDIWKLAAERDDVVVSKDADFADLAVLSQSRQAVVWLRMGNTRKQPLLQRMTAAMPEVIAALDAGDKVVEVR